MATQDVTKDLDTVLSYLVGRRLSTKEMCAALEMSRTTYYGQRADGRLISADNLIRAARNLGLNEVHLLVRYGLVAASSAVEYTEQLRPAPLVAETAHSPVRFDPEAPGL
jgi:hypothetical protein